MALSDIELYFKGKLGLMFISYSSDDVIDDCKNFLNETQQECDLISLEGNIFYALLK